ncbi:MAG: hypothetical protein GF317_19505, partial [Candidatus Lokiarchaeota archaeon]|nr:hypothetical protein [Candidatus Lokiarchaeota archaeon]MBD3201683.1 hypothetical protein [Candidatus Lokiarchaeota archaeon]
MSKASGVAVVAIILALAGVGLGAYTIFFQIPNIDAGKIFGRAELRTDQAIPNSGTYLITLSSDGIDRKGVGWDANNHYFTILTSGVYFISFSITFIPNTASQGCRAILRLNAGDHLLQSYAYIDRGDPGTAQSSDMVELNAGDQLRLLGSIQNDGEISGDSYGSLTFLSIRLI